MYIRKELVGLFESFFAVLAGVLAIAAAVATPVGWRFRIYQRRFPYQLTMSHPLDCCVA